MRFAVDLRRCEGHGLCAEAAPDLFEIDDDGELVVLVDGEQVPEGQGDAAAGAARVCPVGALTVEP